MRKPILAFVLFTLPTLACEATPPQAFEFNEPIVESPSDDLKQPGEQKLDQQGESGPIAKIAQPLSQGFSGETVSNDTSGTATPLASNDTVVRANIFPNADVDFYSFSANAGDKVFVATMTSGSAGSNDSVLTLLASDGTTTIEADNNDGSQTATSSTIAGALIPSNGTYFLKVADNSTAAAERPYDLHFRVQAATGTPTAEVEANDTPGTANVLPVNGWVSGTRNPAAASEQDWYSFTANAGDTVFLSLDVDPERDATVWNGRLGVALFGDASNQVLVVDDAGTGDAIPSEAMFMTVKTAGTYYAFVDSSSAAVGGPTATYTLSVSIHPATNPAGTTNCTVYTSTDIPKTIGPGAGLVSSTITVPGNPRIADVDLLIEANHAVNNQIDLHLRSPQGTDTGIATDIGAAATGGQTQWDLEFDDEAAAPPAFTTLKSMKLQPEAQYKLALFDGQNGGGTWTLDVYDDTADASGGTLTNWGIRICEPSPPPTCAGNLTASNVFSTNFESNNGGFAHSGTADEWEYGTPATVATTTAQPVAGITTCNSGVNCWKTDLDNTYNASSSQDLLSPSINLITAVAPVNLSWAMKYQVETAQFDHMSVDIQEVGGANARRLFDWTGGNPYDAPGNPAVNVPAGAGWGTYTATVSEYIGKNVELKFHLDSDTTVQLAGLAVDDIAVTHCPATCGNSIVEPGEDCDLGAANGTASSCCGATCDYELNTKTCRAGVDDCDADEKCSGSTDTCPTDVDEANGTGCDDADDCTQTDECQTGICTGSNDVVCTASDQCHTSGICNPADGICTDPAKTNGAGCDDTNDCTQTDECQAGVCTGSNDVVCTASDQCHAVGVCNPANGTCSDPNAANGTGCDDGDACTTSDECQAGVCGGTADTCDDSNACTSDSCVSGTGCQNVNICIGDAGTDAGDAGDGGPVGDSGTNPGAAGNGNAGNGNGGNGNGDGDSGTTAGAPNAGSSGNGNGNGGGPSGGPDIADASADASTASSSAGDSGGCGCELVGSSDGSSDVARFAALLALLGLVVGRRRR